MINSGAVTPYLKEITRELFFVILVVFLLAGSGHAIALALGHLLWKDTRS